MLGELRDMLFGLTGPRGGKREGLLKKAAARADADFGAAPNWCIQRCAGCVAQA